MARLGSRIGTKSSRTHCRRICYRKRSQRTLRPSVRDSMRYQLQIKRAYWAYFFQALAGAEAGLRSTANVRHAEPETAVVDSVSHRMVRGEGLLQLTFEDADRYGFDFDWAGDRMLPEHDPQKTILQPKNNLLCGVNILTNQLIDQRQPLLSPSSYWSTSRPGRPGYDTFLKQMTNAPSVCGRTLHRRASASTTTTAGASEAAANSVANPH
jgi:hypothetical protein